MSMMLISFLTMICLRTWSIMFIELEELEEPEKVAEQFL